MNCVWESLGGDRYRCKNCNVTIRLPQGVGIPKMNCKKPKSSTKIPQDKKRSGVGTELITIFKAWGIKSCHLCHSLAEEMDRNGIQWCVDNREELIERILSNAEQRKWIGIVAKRFPKASKIGIAKALDQAIENAREK